MVEGNEMEVDDGGDTEESANPLISLKGRSILNSTGVSFSIHFLNIANQLFFICSSPDLEGEAAATRPPVWRLPTISRLLQPTPTKTPRMPQDPSRGQASL